MPYEPLHHKYRPQTFADLVGQEMIALTLSNALKQGRIAPAYLFTGPRGTGKTSSARILAKSLNCLASSKPTPNPCGQCEACLAIAKGSALDVMEIDAASNTGVDNIREIIERSRFAPVQCRYKIYAIDECLTGDSLIQTNQGLIRIDNPNLKGKKVLSYNENTNVWEYKKVLRWLERGTKKTITIKTGNYQITCTENHLIRTETGWIKAGNVKEGMMILSPVNADVVHSYSNIPSPQWNTSLERVESVSHAGYEKVYDLEVEDNHNFVANGLLIHNCHMLSTAAFNALLKTLEEPPPQVVFILATTDPQRVLSTIISRCQRFDYRRIPLGEMTAHLKYIAVAEQIAIADDALTLIAQIANGGLRDAESLLDQLSLLPETISVAKVWDLVGAVPEQDLLILLKAIRENNSLAILKQCRSLLDRGKEPLVVLQNLASFYLNLLIAKTAPQGSSMISVTETCWQELGVEAQHWSTVEILRGQQHLKSAETQLKQTTQPRLWLEVTLLGLLPQTNLAIANQTETIVNSTPALSKPQSPANPQLAAPATPAHTATIQNTPPVDQVAVEKNIAPAAQTVQKSDQETVETRQQHLVKQNTEPQSITNSQATVSKTVPDELASVSVSQSVIEPVAANSNQDPVANQRIWNQVINCIQSEMTKTLLVQRCHLVSFDGTSAIVGISNATLQKLNQGKVPKIEAAFAQVCQRPVKVQLEVANVKDNAANNSTASTKQPPTRTTVLEPKPQGNAPVSNVTITTTSSITSQETVKSPSLPSQNLVASNQTPSPSTITPTKTNHLAQANQPPTKISEPEETKLSLSLPSEAKQDIAPTSIAEVDNRNADTNYLQQAIANLTQSFEGELVQLDSREITIPEVSEAQEIVESVSYSDRPNTEDYDDDW